MKDINLPMVGLYSMVIAVIILLTNMDTKLDQILDKQEHAELEHLIWLDHTKKKDNK